MSRSTRACSSAGVSGRGGVPLPRGGDGVIRVSACRIRACLRRKTRMTWSCASARDSPKASQQSARFCRVSSSDGGIARSGRMIHPFTIRGQRTTSCCGRLIFVCWTAAASAWVVTLIRNGSEDGCWSLMTMASSTSQRRHPRSHPYRVAHTWRSRNTIAASSEGAGQKRTHVDAHLPP